MGGFESSGGAHGGGKSQLCAAVSTGAPACSSRLGAPAVSPTASSVARHRSASASAAAPSEGYFARICAAAPATWGHAIEVPDMTAVALSADAHAAVIAEPCMEVCVWGGGDTAPRE